MTNVYMYVNANRLILIRESDWGGGCIYLRDSNMDGIVEMYSRGRMLCDAHG